MKTLSIPVKREYLSKSHCLSEARRIIADKLIDGMSERQLAAEIHFHAIAYYYCEKTGRFRRYRMHADPIDICDGGDTRLRRAVFAACWMLKGR